MPTLSENFGYVFVEALAAGCPLLISDRTVWDDIEEKRVGWRITLEDRPAYVERIRECLAMAPATYTAMSQRARLYAEDWLSLDETDAANARVLRYAASRSTLLDSVTGRDDD